MRDGLHSSFCIFENAVIKEVQISTHFVINVIVIIPLLCRGDEWSIKIFNRSQNFTFARFARKI